MKPTFEMYTLEISLMMPENHIESVFFPWVFRSTALKMLKMGKYGVLGVF